ncbi:SGNH/GDSL hydrolase family protein [Lactobacillus sp. Sy-1]|uniref:SGNH/GDSL hydrolase family protein n=1 Tax=Lactobacillus sp. Sy-1 TaxID=2109645 RepID=UPI001C5B3032|nr:SGNH/GDSL hydrolase family protein [Lactobacillus sp. Sy-1]MBW1606115.1 SGNH/GDSL hydrolase family protein [Lactobacillus sp. Sy-1]
MNNKLFKTIMATILGGISYKVAKSSIQVMRGNNDLYAPSNNFYNPNSRLNDKRIIFLGSSITYGLTAKGDSFVDYLATEHGVNAQKEALSGSTIAGNDPSSYVERLKNNVVTNQDIDALVCQISNDQQRNKPLGEISNTFNIDDFDPSTTIGALEYIISYANEHWNCPVVFFTCLKNDDTDYELLRKMVFKLQRKWNFEIIDLWNNEYIQNLNQTHPEYMADSNHPTRAGYRYCWTPVFVRELDQIVD